MERALYLHVKSLSPFTLFMADKIWPYTVISAALDQRCCYFTKIRKNGFLPCFQMMKKVHLFFNIIFHILRTSHKSSECGLVFTSSEQINAINSHLYAKAALRQQQNGWALTHTQLPPEIPHSAENSTLACITQAGEVNSFFFNQVRTHGSRHWLYPSFHRLHNKLNCPRVQKHRKEILGCKILYTLGIF